MKSIARLLHEIATVMRRHYRLILCDEGAALVIIGAVFIYSTLYGAGYYREVAEQIPVAVIDHSRTAESRRLIEHLHATPQLDPRYLAADIKEAQRFMYERLIHGAIYIPSEYATHIQRGEQATLGIYCDASYFLLYRQTFKGFVEAINATSAEICAEQRGSTTNESTLQNSPKQTLHSTGSSAILRTPQIHYTDHNLFNPSLGYGSFVMPAILLLILQQTALIGIGLVAGTRREGLQSRLLDRLDADVVTYTPSPLAEVVGQWLTYLCIYAVTSTAILAPLYVVMGYPMRGSLLACATIIGLYLTAVILLAISLSALFRRREEPFVWLLWLSIPALLMSGASLPAEAFPPVLHLLGQLLPSSSAITAWIRVESMGATLGDIAPQLLRLAALIVLYGTCAYLTRRPRHQQ
ncbi:MAG: ABC transporter permease [Alistipes sp.]|nr:ABC transporter permease [Alistipes sp.]